MEALVTAAAVVDRSSGIGDVGIGDVVEFIPVDGVEDVDIGGIDDVSIVDGSPLYCGCEIGNVGMYGGGTQYVFLDTTSGLFVTADVVNFTPVDGGIGDVVEVVDTGGGGIDDASIVDGSPLYCGCGIGNVDMYGYDTQYVKLVVGGIEDEFIVDRSS